MLHFGNQIPPNGPPLLSPGRFRSSQASCLAAMLLQRTWPPFPGRLSCGSTFPVLMASASGQFGIKADCPPREAPNLALGGGTGYARSLPRLWEEHRIVGVARDTWMTMGLISAPKGTRGWEPRRGPLLPWESKRPERIGKHDPYQSCALSEPINEISRLRIGWAFLAWDFLSDPKRRQYGRALVSFALVIPLLITLGAIGMCIASLWMALKGAAPKEVPNTADPC